MTTLKKARIEILARILEVIIKNININSHLYFSIYVYYKIGNNTEQKKLIFTNKISKYIENLFLRIERAFSEFSQIRIFITYVKIIFSFLVELYLLPSIYWRKIEDVLDLDVVASIAML